jgi:hypothetical protein
MAISFNPYVVALFVLGPPLGFFVVGILMMFIRWTADTQKRQSLRPIDFWLGTAERYVTMALFATDHLPAFIGAWVALKFAANWRRRTGEPASEGSMIFLIGNVLSFGFAIGLALLAQWLSGR